MRYRLECNIGEADASKVHEKALELKQQQYNAAMELYSNRIGYRIFGKLVSIANVSLQIYLIFLLARFPVGWAEAAVAFLLAFVLADFLNGLIHMIMDNSDRYDMVVGPLVAAFHLHHRTPMYKVNPLHLVYFNESGAKVWLVPYLAAVALVINLSPLPPALSHMLVYFGVLSSVAEVSHYLCHTSTSRTAQFLGRTLLLSKRHHARHHISDNNNYAFLNGCTDPLINVIARRFFPGYKTHTDLHYARYEGEGTANR